MPKPLFIGSRAAFKGRCSVEAHHSVGAVVFASATGRSDLAPANLPLWKVDKEVDGVVQPAIVDFSRYGVGQLVFVHADIGPRGQWVAFVPEAAIELLVEAIGV